MILLVLDSEKTRENASNLLLPQRIERIIISIVFNAKTNWQVGSTLIVRAGQSSRWLPGKEKNW